MILLDGKQTSAAIKVEIALAVTETKKQGKRAPHLAAVLVGNNGASMTYVGAKVKACELVGFSSTLIDLPVETTEAELLAQIHALNENPEIDGFIVQLPLPKHIDEQKILMAVHPDKDVDGFHPTNVGRMALDLPTFLSATPYGIMELLERYKVPTSGKHVVVIGRSHIVGRPMSILMSQKRPAGDATVTIAHSRTTNLEKLTLDADIIVAALGIPEFLTAEMVKPGALRSEQRRRGHLIQHPFYGPTAQTRQRPIKALRSEQRRRGHLIQHPFYGPTAQTRRRHTHTHTQS